MISMGTPPRRRRVQAFHRRGKLAAGQFTLPEEVKWKGTQKNRRIFGAVTMQEKGVSKMLTINMNEMAKELKIE